MRGNRVLLKGHGDSRAKNSDRAEAFGACRGFGRDLGGVYDTDTCTIRVLGSIISLCSVSSEMAIHTIKSVDGKVQTMKHSVCGLFITCKGNKS